MRTFGTPAEGADMRFRRAAYAVIAGPHDSVAAVATRLGLFLPGGGAEQGETPEETVRRECREEIGRAVCITGSAREALQYFSVDGVHHRMQAVFLEAALLDESPAPCEHQLLWVTSRDAGRFFHRSHAWAAGFAAE